LVLGFEREVKQSVGKWKSCFWISTFPRGNGRGCGNVGISVSDFQVLVGGDGKAAFVFLAARSPAFPQPSRFKRFVFVRSWRTASALLRSSS
jgi:hypothetical protein